MEEGGQGVCWLRYFWRCRCRINDKRYYFEQIDYKIFSTHEIILRSVPDEEAHIAEIVSQIWRPFTLIEELSYRVSLWYLGKGTQTLHSLNIIRNYGKFFDWLFLNGSGIFLAVQLLVLVQVFLKQLIHLVVVVEVI